MEGRVNEITELEKRLTEVGYGVGIRFLELISARERNFKREIKLVGILSFIHSTVWKVIFGKQADALEQSTDHDDEYMIIENQPVISKYISTPKDMSGLNCAAFVGGIIQGVLDAAEFTTEKVTAHTVGAEERTVFLIKFQPEVIERKKRNLS